MYLKFSRVRDVKAPVRANAGDAGIDFFVPFSQEPITLLRGESALIPAGVKVEVPFGYAVIFHNKSGVAAKKNLLVGADTVDHAYAGEVHINLVNVGLSVQTINPGDKIIQGIMVPIILAVPLEVEESTLYNDIYVVGSRGAGGFGSTGTQ